LNRRVFLGGVGASLFFINRPFPLYAESLSNTTPSSSFEPSDAKAMEDCVESYLRKWKVPGISLSITKDGALLYNQAFGFADPRKKEPLTTSHRFRIASLSKSITSV